MSERDRRAAPRPRRPLGGRRAQRVSGGASMTGTLLTAFLALMVTGIPVAIAMAGASLIYIWLSGSSPPMVVVHRMISGLDSFPLLAVPFFILAGNLMNNAGITNRIYNFALALVGWMKGGLGHVNIIGSVIFAGMSGTAIADAAGLGTIEIKAMRDHGYSKEFSVGVTAASATLGPIIPPSLPFVIYGMVANVSIGQLFLAGILPGLVMTVLMMLTVAYFAHKNNWGADIKFVWSRVGKATLELADRHRVPAGDLGCGAARRQPAGRDRRGDAAAVRRRLEMEVRGGAADHDAGAADRRHDDGHLHADRGRGRGVHLGAVPRPLLVSHAVVQDADQGVDGDDRDDGDGAVHRRRRVDLRLAPDRDARHRHGHRVGAGLHALAVGVPAARQPAAALRRLLPRADGGDPDRDSGADAGGDCSSASTPCISASSSC